ncbi:MAG: hypothetical protein ACLFUY_09630, partial [Desulfobacterales bacterium]
ARKLLFRAADQPRRLRISFVAKIPRLRDKQLFTVPSNFTMGKTDMYDNKDADIQTRSVIRQNIKQEKPERSCNFTSIRRTRSPG